MKRYSAERHSARFNPRFELKKLFQLAALFTAVALPCSAAELAQLKNGFSIRHEHREVLGSTTRLYLSATDSSYIDVATDQIASCEHDDTTVPSPAPASPITQKPISEHVTNASQTHGIDEDFLNTVIRHESGFNPKAVSPKGARGLMQLMPDTATKLGVKDSFDPGENVDGGTRYLRELLDRYNGDAVKALAAYNAGPHRVEQYKGVPPYRETRAYVAGIIREYNRKKLAASPTLANGQAAKTIPSSAGASRKSTPRRPVHTADGSANKREHGS